MTGIALALVLAAAFIHATWNLIAKRVDEKLPFLWCSALVSVVLFFPLGAWLVATQTVAPMGWLIVVLSGLLEATYLWSLARAYRYGDLSQVYPIARGTAPLLVPLLALVFLGEPTSLVALGGIVVVVGGIVLLLAPARATAGSDKAVVAVRGVAYALLTGAIIATYSTLDRRGVSLVSPLLYAYLIFVALTLILLPVLVPQRAAVAGQWRRHRGAILAVGVLSPLGYGLVLLALTITPVSTVAAAREVSVVIAALLGALVLREPYGRRRVLGSACIAAGLVLLVFG